MEYEPPTPEICDELMDVAIGSNTKSIEMIEFLFHAGANLHGIAHKSILSQAAIHNRPDIVQLLLNLQADVNITDLQKCTALHYSVQLPDTKVTEILLAAGADVTLEDHTGTLPVDLAVKGNRELVKKVTPPELIGREKLCVYCKKTQGKSKCGKCHVMRYCSKECQVADWKTHKQICSTLKE